MIFRFLFYIFLLYLVYRLVFHFILPIYRTTKQVKKGFREMHEKMWDQPQQANPQPEHPKKEGKNQVGEYIDFEEIE